MKQQINLYQERFHIKRVVLPANEVYGWLGLGLVLLILVSVFLEVAKVQMQRAQADLQHRQQMMTIDNEKLKNSIDTHQVDPQLQEAVADANRKLMARRRVLEWVKRSQSEERVLFSDVLEGLGRRHINGLWLSNVSIDEKGDSMQLMGNALNPKLIPELLAALKQEKAFAGTEFRKIRIEEEKPQSTIMQFLLTTKPPQNDKETSKRKRRVRS